MDNNLSIVRCGACNNNLRVPSNTQYFICSYCRKILQNPSYITPASTASVTVGSTGSTIPSTSIMTTTNTIPNLVPKSNTIPSAVLPSNNSNTTNPSYFNNKITSLPTLPSMYTTNNTNNTSTIPTTNGLNTMNTLTSSLSSYVLPPNNSPLPTTTTTTTTIPSSSTNNIYTTPVKSNTNTTINNNNNNNNNFNNIVTGDSCSAEEEKRADELYLTLVTICKQNNILFVDPSFPPTDYSIGAGAEISVTFTGTSVGRRNVRIPIIWRRPNECVDENNDINSKYINNNRNYLLQDIQNLLKSLPTGVLQELMTKLLIPINSTNMDNILPILLRPFTTVIPLMNIQDSYSLPCSLCPKSDIEFLKSQLEIQTKINIINNTNTNTTTNQLNEWCLKRDLFRTEDVVQGTLGTCWFISAVSLVAERQYLVRRLFRDICIPSTMSSTTSSNTSISNNDQEKHLLLPLNPYGIYQIRLCIHGIWRIITIDDTLPTSSYTGKLVFGTSRRRQLWVSLLEKAVAKATGSFAGIDSGTTAEGLRLLTGAPTESIAIRTNEREEIRSARWRKQEKLLDITETTPKANQDDDNDDEDDNDEISLSLHLLSNPIPVQQWEFDFFRVPPLPVLDALWSRLRTYQENGYLMGVSSHVPTYNDIAQLSIPDPTVWRANCERYRDFNRSLGIIMSHAYSILQLITYTPPSSPNTIIRLIKLRNPWASGNGERSIVDNSPNTWQGKWNDNDTKLWNMYPELRDQLGPYGQQDSGIFWMNLEDFILHFSRLDVARIQGFVRKYNDDSFTYDSSLYNVVRTRIPLPCAKLGYIHVLKLQPLADTRIEIVASAREPRTNNRIVNNTNTTTSSNLALVDAVSPVVYGRDTYRNSDDDTNENTTTTTTPVPTPKVRNHRRKRINDIDMSITIIQEFPNEKEGLPIVQALWPNYKQILTHGPRLALETTKMLVLPGTGHQRQLNNIINTEAFLLNIRANNPQTLEITDGPVYYCFVTSMNGYNIEDSNQRETVVVELHSTKPILVSVETKSIKWFTKALLCRTITYGKPQKWTTLTTKNTNEERETRIIILWGEDAGTSIVAINLHPENSYEVTVTAKLALNYGRISCATVSRPNLLTNNTSSTEQVHTLLDILPPLHAQILQIISPLARPINYQGTTWSWSYRTSIGIRFPFTLLLPDDPRNILRNYTRNNTVINNEYTKPYYDIYGVPGYHEPSILTNDNLHFPLNI